MRRIVTCVIFILVSVMALAQQDAIKGCVKDSDGNPVPGAIIKATSSSTILGYTTSDDKGGYSLSVERKGDVVVSVDCLGYESSSVILHKDTSGMCDFSLKEKRIGLKEAVVRAPAIRQLGDTLSYAVSAYTTRSDYTLKDALGREWQCGTIQVDPNMPERLEAEFTGEDGVRHRPVMLHRAIVGSLERFIGILIEQYAGALPTWLAPEQVSVLNITDAQADYAQNVAQMLQNQGVRATADLSNDKITYKIRSHATRKLPYILVVGDKEKESATVAVRARGNQDLGVMSLEDFMQRVRNDIACKSVVSSA